MEVKAKRAKTEWVAGLKKLPGNVTFAKETFVCQGLVVEFQKKRQEK